MDQIFNELSLSASLPDDYAAHDALLDLKKASDKLHDLGFSLNIRVTEDFNTRKITPGHTIHDYLRRKVGGAQKTLQGLLLKRFSGAPYVEQLCQDAQISFLEEYTLDNEICKGLGLASHIEVPALSVAGDERFTPPFVTLRHSRLKTENGEICTVECPVGIICAEDDVQHHKEAIKAALAGPISTGTELLNYAGRWLPRLRFSLVAQDQLMNIPRNDPRLSRVQPILEELQRAMQQAVDTQTFFSPQGFKYTPAESSSATQGKNREKHTFRFVEPDASGSPIQFTLLCEAHMWITDGERIYFYGDRNKGRVYIGHIGEHLPGKKYG